MKKKLTKRDYKKILPSELYLNVLKGKRGKGDMYQIVNTRVPKDEHSELIELLDTINVKRSAFVRIAIQKYMQEVKGLIADYEKE